MMGKIILEGSKFTDNNKTHEILKELFNFPDYYGKNLDALWDCITDWYLNENAIIIWKDFNISKEYLGEDADIMVRIFRRASEEYHRFTIEVLD